LAATEEAVEIYRRLATANPTLFDRELALTLTNLGVGLSALGRREAALAATEEAVEIYRRLATTNPAVFDAEPELATALSNLGIWLSDLGRRDAALAATEEAVEIYRRLATANPAVFDPELAQSLWAIGWVRVSAGTELDGALTAVKESIEIFKRLAAALPNVFGGRLVGVYRTAADVLDQLGRTEEASAIRHQLGDEDEPGSIA
jgi:tetratricopeptide (TPR) repeat protein